MALVFIAATILAVGVGLQRRKARFERLFSYHIGLAGPALHVSFSPDPMFETAKAQWHYDLAWKYAEAAKRPWIPVQPDPPEPN
jgi:hypothetical protein